MPVRNPFLIILAAVVFAAFTGQVLGHGKDHNPGRFDFVKSNGIPSVYRERVNPLSMTNQNLGAGEALYANNCASCHGATGEGDGVVAADLKPPPANLTGMYERPMTGMGEINIDAYNFWAVSEGGTPLGSSMPAFKEMLAETERWQILLYLANGFSPGTGE